MDEQEFERILDLFPIVRSRDYCADSELPRHQSALQSTRDELTEWQDAWSEEDKKGTEIRGIETEEPFWQKLKLAAEKKVGAAEAEKFCKAFQVVHRKLAFKNTAAIIHKKIQDGGFDV